MAVCVIIITELQANSFETKANKNETTVFFIKKKLNFNN